MKTAMQEAIELVKKYDNREIPMKVLFYNLELLLEKEKEQSINLIKQTCMFMGASIIDIEISKMEFIDIYNNYYNQNK